MNRRTFLKALAISPAIPSVLVAQRKVPTLTLHAGTDKEVTDEWRPIPAKPKVWTERWNCETKFKTVCDENGNVVNHTRFLQLPFVVFTDGKMDMDRVKFVERKILV